LSPTLAMNLTYKIYIVCYIYNIIGFIFKKIQQYIFIKIYIPILLDRTIVQTFTKIGGMISSNGSSSQTSCVANKNIFCGVVGILALYIDLNPSSSQI
jgi:hypothetical protein